MHKKSAISKTIHHCEICYKKVVGSKFKLNSHLFQHGVVESRFQCSYCLKEFYRRDAYNWHMNSMHKINRKMYSCDHCDSSFLDKRNLILHLTIHDDLFIKRRPQKTRQRVKKKITRFKCTACGTNYCEQRSLDNHIRKTHFSFHNSEPHFLKKELNETWVEKVKGSELYVQITKVNNNVLKIKKCDTIKIETENLEECDETYPSEYMKSVQTTVCTTQYSVAICDYCKKNMIKKSLLKHIQERHLKLKKFKCEKCSEHFNRHYQLANHICGRVRRQDRKN